MNHRNIVIFLLGAAGVLGCADSKTTPTSKESTMPAIQAPKVPGLVTLPSAHNAAETLNRLEKLLKEKGIVVFARIDHAAGADKARMKLRPTEVLIFGNPIAGTPLMQSRQTIGIDLPLRALAWEDESGKSWLSYNEPAYLAQRHQISDRDEAVQKLTAGLEALARAATSP
jgi:uncharacterized protein (DUF302 family)